MSLSPQNIAEVASTLPSPSLPVCTMISSFYFGAFLTKYQGFIHSIEKAEKLLFQARQKQEESRHFKKYTDQAVERMLQFAEMAEHRVFEADLEMGRLATVLEEAGFRVDMFSLAHRGARHGVWSDHGEFTSSY
jgi:hypothetical protein